MCGVEVQRQAEAAWIFFSRLRERFMPPPWGFRSGKGAWLGSQQNQAKMPGGLNKTDYESSIHLVTEQSSMMQPISNCNIHLVGVVSL